MAYSLRKPLESAEFATLEDKLRIEFKGRFYSYGGSKDKKDYFCAVWVEDSVLGKVFGHLTGPHGNHATFYVEKGKSFPRYRIMPEPGCTASLDVLERHIKHGIKNAYKRVTTKSYAGPRDTSNYLGYYLRRINGTWVAATTDLDLAVAEKVVSELFRETCLAHGLRMEKYPKA